MKCLSQLFALLLVFLFLACKPTVPRHIIQPQEMEEILYDCHLADAMAGLIPDSSGNYNARLYRLGVLKKHGVSEAEFDSAMVYYTRHADRLHAIYENLARRMGDDAMALGADVPSSDYIAINKGDTANIWTLGRDIVFLSRPPYNYASMSVDADSTYHRGDRFVFSFDAQFIFQDGMRNGMAHLTVQYQNDSIVTRLMRISAPTHFSLELNNPDSLPVKHVQAYLMLVRDQRSAESTMQLMALSNIQLIRVHPQKGKKTQGVDGAVDNTPSNNTAPTPGNTPPPPTTVTPPVAPQPPMPTDGPKREGPPPTATPRTVNPSELRPSGGR